MKNRILLVAALLQLAASLARAQPPAPQVAFVPRGPDTAAVTIVEFCDFESQPCAQLAVVLRAVVELYPNDVQLTFRHLAAEDRLQSRRAYAAVLAAARQGYGWPMWDMAFANQDRLTDDGLRSMAVQLALDVGAFAIAWDSADADLAVAADAYEAERLGIASGPALIVDGRPLGGFPTLSQLKALVDAKLAPR